MKGSNVKASSKVKPAPEEHIAAILPHLNPTVRAMVEIQYLTGARGGEIWRMTTGQIDRTSEPWIYKPAYHKTADIGKDRTITLGPRRHRGRAPWLKADPSKPLFSPIEAREAQYARRRQERVTPMTPSQRARSAKPIPNDRRGPCTTRTPISRRSPALAFALVFRGLQAAPNPALLRHQGTP